MLLKCELVLMKQKGEKNKAESWDVHWASFEGKVQNFI
jgi:hypothetical protein